MNAKATREALIGIFATSLITLVIGLMCLFGTAAAMLTATVLLWLIMAAVFYVYSKFNGQEDENDA